MENVILTVRVGLDSDLSLLLTVLIDHMENDEIMDYLEDKVREAIQDKYNELMADEDL